MKKIRDIDISKIVTNDTEIRSNQSQKEQNEWRNVVSNQSKREKNHIPEPLSLLQVPLWISYRKE